MPYKPNRAPWMLEDPWSAVGIPPLLLGPSGSSFDPSILAPVGIHHLLLSNLTTGWNYIVGCEHLLQRRNGTDLRCHCAEFVCMELRLRAKSSTFSVRLSHFWVLRRVNRGCANFVCRYNLFRSILYFSVSCLDTGVRSLFPSTASMVRFIIRACVANFRLWVSTIPHPSISHVLTKPWA